MNSIFIEMVNRFIDNQIDLNTLEEFYTPHLPELLEDPNSIEAELIAEIELGMIEIESGRDSLSDVKEKLSKILDNLSFKTIQTSQSEFIISTSATNRVLTDEINLVRKPS